MSEKMALLQALLGNRSPKDPISVVHVPSENIRKIRWTLEYTTLEFRFRKQTEITACIKIYGPTSEHRRRLKNLP